MNGLRVADFDFDLPEELIAQQPARGARPEPHAGDEPRWTATLRDASFAEFPSLLKPGDLLVLNESRVIPPGFMPAAQLVREREKPTGRRSKCCSPSRYSQKCRVPQVSILRPGMARRRRRGNLWRALVRPGRKVGVGERLVFSSPQEASYCLRRRFWSGANSASGCSAIPAGEDFFAVLDRIGHMPLPPYIRRDDAEADRERYQTVFARERGSVAAPTAGLHFTPQVLDALAAKGVEVARITLHVGLGTFAPLRVERLDEVRLHRERYTLSGGRRRGHQSRPLRGPAHCRRGNNGGAHAGALRAARQWRSIGGTAR
jgi:S-adenosylmethionine:tRNA ribosyltransferase-isomerase